MTHACRAQNWERVSHGTGMGYSTVSGFWIPDKPPPPPPKEAPARAALKGASSAKLKTHTAVASKGAKRITGKPTSSRKHDSGDRKPPQVRTCQRRLRHAYTFGYTTLYYTACGVLARIQHWSPSCNASQD